VVQPQDNLLTILQNFFYSSPQLQEISWSIFFMKNFQASLVLQNARNLQINESANSWITNPRIHYEPTKLAHDVRTAIKEGQFILTLFWVVSGSAASQPFVNLTKLFLFFTTTAGNKLEHFFMKNFQASLVLQNAQINKLMNPQILELQIHESTMNPRN
jgi:hypothetical protein